MQFTFKIGQKIKEAWPLYKENFSSLLLLMIITFVIQMIGSKKNWILMLISYVVGLLISYVWIRYNLSLVDKKSFNPFSRTALPTLNQFFNFFITTILLILCIMGGLILLIIPGIYFMGRLVFALYLSVDKNQGAIISIKESWKMTEGYGWLLFWKSFVIGLFIIIGFIALFVGSIITYPLGMIVMIMMYREFSKMKLQNVTVPNQNEVKVETPVGEIVKQ